VLTPPDQRQLLVVETEQSTAERCDMPEWYLPGAECDGPDNPLTLESLDPSEQMDLYGHHNPKPTKVADWGVGLDGHNSPKPTKVVDWGVGHHYEMDLHGHNSPKPTKVEEWGVGW